VIQELLSGRRIERPTLLIIVINLLLNLSISRKSSVYLPTFHLAGAFQAATGLCRIKWGGIPGIDFFPYLGIGPLITLVTLFLAFGGKLWASLLVVMNRARPMWPCEILAENAAVSASTLLELRRNSSTLLVEGVPN
jgi:hypothetical protein